MHKIGRLLRVCVLAGVIVVPDVAFAAPPGPKAVYAITCLQERYKPKQITIACVDGTVKVTKLKWTSWSFTKARASGVYQVDRCNPSCASGHTRSFPVKVTLSRPKTCPGHKHRAFGRLSYEFDAKRPKPTPGHTSLPCPTGPFPPGY